MEVNALTWIITIVVIAGFFVFDFYAHVRTPHAPTLRESALWSAFYVALAMAFGVFLWFTWGTPEDPHQHGLEFFAGYVTEKALSVDNLFVFALIFGAFAVPREYQQKVLLIGIALALAMRGLFIWLGAAAINAWAEVFYLFGLFLLWTAVKIVVDEVRGSEEKDPKDMLVVRAISRVIPVTRKYHKDRLTLRIHRAFLLTPLAVALVAIGFADVLFALDSIPAIYGLTNEPYIVFTTNAFALMGLRQLFFLLDGLLEKLVYLAYGLAVILGFIGIKLVLHALHENSLGFVNGGAPVAVPEIDTVVSLVFIIGTLLVTGVASMVKTHIDEREGHAAA